MSDHLALTLAMILYGIHALILGVRVSRLERALEDLEDAATDHRADCEACFCDGECEEAER